MSAGDGAADAEPERREHPCQRAVGAVEQDTGSQHHGAQAEGDGRGGGAFPCLAHACQEARAGWCVFVQVLVAACAVVADRRCGHEDTRARLGLLQAFDEPLRAEFAARADAFLALLCPALGDRLAGQVHHAVAAGECVDRRRLGLWVPADRVDTELPSRVSGSA